MKFFVACLVAVLIVGSASASSSDAMSDEDLAFFFQDNTAAAAAPSTLSLIEEENDDDTVDADENNNDDDAVDEETDDDLDKDGDKKVQKLSSSDKTKTVKVLVKKFGVDPVTLKEFSNELKSLKESLRKSYFALKKEQTEYQKAVADGKKKIEKLRPEIRHLANRIRRLKRRAIEDAKKRAARLKEQLEKRMAAHKAGIEFVKKLKKQVDSLKETYDVNFKDSVSDIQSVLLEYADDVKTWTGEDIEEEVQKNKDIGTDSNVKRLYTKKHLSDLVNRMYKKLTDALNAAKSALKKAHAPVPNAHVGRLLIRLNGLKSNLAEAEKTLKKNEATLKKIESGSPSLAEIKSNFSYIKSIEEQIYRDKVEKIQPKAAAGGCKKNVSVTYSKFDQSKAALQQAVAQKAPQEVTYTLWKQYVVAKDDLKKHVKACAMMTEESE